MSTLGGIQPFRRLSDRRRPSRCRAALGYIRQLCISGIDSHLLAPSLVEGARELVGADWGGFCWPDERDRLTAMYVENTDLYRMVPLYAREFGGTHLEQEAFGVDFPTAMRTGRGWENLDLHRERLKLSPYFNELFRPLRIHHGLEVTAAEGRRGWGSLVLYRSGAHDSFSRQDQATLAGLSPLIAHALHATPTLQKELTESAECGLIVVDHRGKIVLVNDCALMMLHQIRDGEHRGASSDDLPLGMLPAVRAARLLAVGSPAPSPMRELSNRWGRFVVRAYAMHGQRSGPSALIALHVRRFEPLSVRVLRNGWYKGLTARQREVCLHIAAQRSYDEIAHILGLRTSTVVDHVRKIYSRLDVHDHLSLLRSLSA